MSEPIPNWKFYANFSADLIADLTNMTAQRDALLETAERAADLLEFDYLQLVQPILSDLRAAIDGARNA